MPEIIIGLKVQEIRRVVIYIFISLFTYNFHVCTTRPQLLGPNIIWLAQEVLETFTRVGVHFVANVDHLEFRFTLQKFVFNH
jgi:hypothetical protein